MEKIVIAALLGWAGGYRFYKKQYSIGVLYLFTVGLFGIGWILDIISAVREYSSANIVPDVLVSPSVISQSDTDSPVFYIHSSKATEKNLQQLSQRFIAFDTETTGVDADNDRIISIAAVLYENGIETDSFYTLVNPGRHIPEDATRINGITDDMAKQGISEAEMCNKFLSFIGDAANSKTLLVAYNSIFDAKLLKYAMERAGISGNIRHFDVLTLAKSKLPNLVNYKQVTVAENLGITTDGAHHALSDCRMCGSILLNLLSRN